MTNYPYQDQFVAMRDALAEHFFESALYFDYWDSDSLACPKGEGIYAFRSRVSVRGPEGLIPSPDFAGFLASVQPSAGRELGDPIESADFDYRDHGCTSAHAVRLAHCRYGSNSFSYG
jgi:hypothetical protein